MWTPSPTTIISSPLTTTNIHQPSFQYLSPTHIGTKIFAYLTFTDIQHLHATSYLLRSWTRECLTSIQIFTAETYGDNQACVAALMMANSIQHQLYYKNINNTMNNNKRTFILRTTKSSDQTMRALHNCFNNTNNNNNNSYSLSLDFSRSIRCTDVGLNYLSYLPISYLDLTGVWRLSDVGLDAISHITTLQFLSIARCYRVTDSGLIRIIQSNHNLQHLDISNCINIRDGQTLVEISQHLTQLTVFKASGLASLITTEGLFALGEGCTQLQDLDVEGASNLQDEGLATLSTQILSLRLSRCPRLTDDVLQIIAYRCPLLQKLELEGFRSTLVNLKHITQQCTQLVHLNLSNSFETSIEVLGILAKSSSLHELDLSNCNGIDDIGLGMFSNNTSTNSCLLSSLSLTGCYDVSNLGMQHMIKTCSNALQRIRLPPTVNDELLIDSLLHCPHLVEIDCSRSENVTNAGVRVLLQSCPQLTILRLDGCKVTDEIFDIIAKYGKHVTKCTFYGCSLLTSSGFTGFLSGNRTLPDFIIDHQGNLLRCPCCSSLQYQFHHVRNNSNNSVAAGGLVGSHEVNAWLTTSGEYRKIEQEADDDYFEFGVKLAMVGLAVIEGIRIVVSHS
jgi:hypothetical protein